LAFREVALKIAHTSWRGLDAAEQQERLAGFLAADRARGFELTEEPLLRLALFELAEDVAEVAVELGAERVTWDELRHRVAQLARHLVASGVRPDERVAVLADRSPDLIATLLGILQSGGAYLPLDPPCPRSACPGCFATRERPGW
jgi:non-ribosomal peptide synthetase component F